MKSLSAEVLTVMLLKTQVFWFVTLCSWASISDVSEDHSAFMFRIKQSKKNNHMEQIMCVVQKCFSCFLCCVPPLQLKICTPTTITIQMYVYQWVLQILVPSFKVLVFQYVLLWKPQILYLLLLYFNVIRQSRGSIYN